MLSDPMFEEKVSDIVGLYPAARIGGGNPALAGRQVAMIEANLKQAALEEILRLDESGELFHDPNALGGPDLAMEFWAKARTLGPRRTRSVHLKLDPEVSAYFVEITGGKGHLTRLQAVLRADVEAMRKG